MAFVAATVASLAIASIIVATIVEPFATDADSTALVTAVGSSTADCCWPW